MCPCNDPIVIYRLHTFGSFRPMSIDVCHADFHGQHVLVRCNNHHHRRSLSQNIITSTCAHSTLCIANCCLALCGSSHVHVCVHGADRRLCMLRRYRWRAVQRNMRFTLDMSTHIHAQWRLPCVACCVLCGGDKSGEYRPRAKTQLNMRTENKTHLLRLGA